jgi:hypothetical protein
MRARSQILDKPLSSLPLQYMIYYDKIFSYFFFFVEFLIFGFKGIISKIGAGLYYSSGNLSGEVIFLTIFMFW